MVSLVNGDSGRFMSLSQGLISKDYRDHKLRQALGFRIAREIYRESALMQQEHIGSCRHRLHRPKVVKP